MSPLRPRTDLGTHEVVNQPEPRGDVDLWAEDPALPDGIAREGAGVHAAHLASVAKTLGRAEWREQGRLANRHPPELVAFDRTGRRIDEVAFHPAYHTLMGLGIAEGYAALPWEDGALSGGHVAHAAMVYLMAQVEPGVCCPMTMTCAAVPALRHDAGLAAEWIPRLLSRRYDPASRPAAQKAGATMAMAMTEKQGGSDVRANTTRAEPDDDGWRLTGHKWFCSAPMSDAFLTLAQAPGGLTCFLVPRWTPDGARNRIQLMRLKDKLGDRANASAEIEYAGAFARRLGDEGAGVRTIIEMVNHTRLDTAAAPAGLMRAALSEALWWCAHRTAFHRRLIEQPLMAAVLADLALEWEGALMLSLRVARAFDESADPEARAFARLAVALAKYTTNKRCPGVIYEAMEAIGGAAYVEESPIPMLFRESPLNSIWEGAGNVICLDVLRTLAKAPEALDALNRELDAARGADRRYDAALDTARAHWPKGPPEGEARWFTETLARLLEASLMLRNAPAPVADAFAATRMAAERGATVGALPASADAAAVVARLRDALMPG